MSGLSEKLFSIESRTVEDDDLFFECIERINPPSLYKKTKEVYYTPEAGAYKGWDKSAVERILKSETAIRKILNNRFYLGEMAYGKSVRKSVGSQNGIAVPKEDWKVIRNHHKAFISEEIYEQVSSFRLDYSTKRNREKHPLTGKLYCGGCGYSMIYKPLHEKNR
ncbi:recombinase family protein [Agathobacter sp.]|uniref:recombinase family protein n=1 Tax=Agathobacter sp. TaxID=2021311 RepID=UPI00280BA4EA|nr:recombinase family protein [Agathobacter sp.]